MNRMRNSGAMTYFFIIVGGHLDDVIRATCRTFEC